MKEVMIPPLATTVVTGMVDLTTYSKSLLLLSQLQVIQNTYQWKLRQGKGKINICHRNHSARQVTLPKQTTVGEITPANMIPALLDQNPTGLEEDKREPPQRKRKIKVKKNY